jgi:hypothetical protein
MLVLYNLVKRNIENIFHNADIMIMKKTKEGEELVKVGYRLPPDVIRFIEKSAIENRRSVNDEVIVLLEAALAAGGAPVSGAGLERYMAIRDGAVRHIAPPEPDPDAPA